MNDSPPGPAPGTLHHVEIWVPDLTNATEDWGWLLESLGYSPYQEWPAGKSWRKDHTYLVFEQSPALTAHRHDRRAPGLNHLAFHAGSRRDVDALVETATGNGTWRLLFPDRHPHAGGPGTYAAYLENRDRFEIELIAHPAS
ncbi:VOC family protein [Streptomyces shenzhenensis]|uniref:VOC family protein n=1 Tax=Streptomyces shenzhenensis TaxID=943815 RepID=UPI003D8D1A11